MSKAKCPVRLTRSRQQKNESPNGLPVVYIGRPGIWGNPFKQVNDLVYVYAGHRRRILDPWVWFDADGKTAVDLFYDMLMDLNSHPVEDAVYKHMRRIRDRIFDLNGKNLLCWCKQGQCCHGDVLLKVANPPLLKEFDNNVYEMIYE